MLGVFSHCTCESPSMLTKTCRKPSPMAFALHLSIDGSATYSRIGKLFVDAALGAHMKRWLVAGTAAGGQVLASDLPPRAPAAYIPPPSPVYNWGGIYFGFNLGYGFGTSKWTDPHEPPGSTGNFNVMGFVVGP